MNDVSSRVSEGRDGPARPGRSSRWSLGRRVWKESPAASSAAEVASGGIWGFALRWLPVEAEGLGGSARSRGNGWWCWMDGGGSGCDALHWIVAATELAGDGEESFPTSIAG